MKLEALICDYALFLLTFFADPITGPFCDCFLLLMLSGVSLFVSCVMFLPVSFCCKCLRSVEWFFRL